MIGPDEIKYVFKNILHRKLRSFLTTLSILIGVMAVAAIISFGMGLNKYIDSLSESTGVDKLFIMSKGVGGPGTDSTFSLSKEDVDFIQKINGVQKAEPIYMKISEIRFGKEKKYFYLNGLDGKEMEFFEESFGIKIEYGKRIKGGELEKVVLGYLYTKDNKIFKKRVNLGDQIEIDGNTAEVIGFVSEIGNPNDDAQMYVSKEYYEKLYPAQKDIYSFVIASAASGESVDGLAKTIKEKLRKHLGQKEGKETFYVMTMQDAIKTFQTILNVVNGVLVLIALISVIVASVNIMNTMYTAVLERTKEIGVMKAVGAQNKDIFFIFVFESGLLGLIGGATGMLLGYFIAYVGGIIAKAYGYAMLAPAFPWYLTVLCLFFSFAVGAFSGLFPAKQAAKQKPVDALRYE